MITYKIHLIRHGITDGNLQGKYIGVTDLPLSPDGVNELLELKGLIEYPNVKKVYTSPLLRARQSANILFGDTEQMAVENLKEFNFGIFENKTAAEGGSFIGYPRSINSSRLSGNFRKIRMVTVWHY